MYAQDFDLSSPMPKKLEKEMWITLESAGESRSDSVCSRDISAESKWTSVMRPSHMKRLTTSAV